MGEDDFTQTEAEVMAEALLREASDHLRPFASMPHHRPPLETLLLASIAASNLAIAKAQPKRRKTT